MVSVEHQRDNAPQLQGFHRTLCRYDFLLQACDLPSICFFRERLQLDFVLRKRSVRIADFLAISRQLPLNRDLQLLGQNSPLRLLRGRRVFLERRAGNDPEVYGFASLGDPDDLIMSDFLALRICG